MRRFRLIAWALIAVLLLDWTPGFPPLPLETASAQTPAVTVIGPAGTLYYSTASVVIANTATAGTNLFSIIIPGAMFATQAAANTSSTMTAGLPTLGPLNSSIPLHLQIAGVLDTASSPGTVSAVSNFGVGTTSPTGCAPVGFCSAASIAMANAFTPGPSMAQAPFALDVYITPIATGNLTNLAAAGNATPNIVNTVLLRGRLEITSATPSYANVLQAATYGQVNTASAHILNVLWGFGSAGNFLRVHSVILRQGI